MDWFIFGVFTSGFGAGMLCWCFVLRYFEPSPPRETEPPTRLLGDWFGPPTTEPPPPPPGRSGYTPKGDAVNAADLKPPTGGTAIDPPTLMEIAIHGVHAGGSVQFGNGPIVPVGKERTT